MTSAALNRRPHWTCLRCHSHYCRPMSRRSCSRCYNCCSHRIDHGGHGKRGKTLQRSMSDALRLELYILPCLPSRRKRIFAVAVLGLNLAVLAMNHQFGFLVLRDLPSAIHRVLLAVEHLSVALGASTPDGPSIFTGDYMLIAFAHPRLLVTA